MPPLGPPTTSRLLLAALLALSLGACTRGLIPGTDVPASEENRQVYAIVMAYERAMEDRDVDAIMSLVSRDYYENGGTTDRDDDDYGYEELRDSVLPRLVANVRQIRYRIIVTRITVDGERATADFEYFYNFRYVEGGVDGWTTKNDFNRLDLKREGVDWKIVAGL